MGPGLVIQGLTVRSNTQVLLSFSLCFPQWVFFSSYTAYSSRYHLTIFQGQRAKKGECPWLGTSFKEKLPQSSRADTSSYLSS